MFLRAVPHGAVAGQRHVRPTETAHAAMKPNNPVRIDGVRDSGGIGNGSTVAPIGDHIAHHATATVAGDQIGDRGARVANPETVRSVLHNYNCPASAASMLFYRSCTRCAFHNEGSMFDLTEGDSE